MDEKQYFDEAMDFFNEEEFEEALEYFEKLTQDNPKCQDAWFMMAVTLINLEDHQTAQVAL